METEFMIEIDPKRLNELIEWIMEEESERLVSSWKQREKEGYDDDLDPRTQCCILERKKWVCLLNTQQIFNKSLFGDVLLIEEASREIKK